MNIGDPLPMDFTHFAVFMAKKHGTEIILKKNILDHQKRISRAL